MSHEVLVSLKWYDSAVFAVIACLSVRPPVHPSQKISTKAVQELIRRRDSERERFTTTSYM